MPKRRNNKGVTYSGQPTTHPTDNLQGYPAVDIMAPPGTPFRAPEKGTIIRISGRDPKMGATSAHGAFGYSIYFKGKSGTIYFITHLGHVRGKGRYDAGSILGTIGNFPGGTPDHAHVGIHIGPKGLPDYAQIQQGGFWSGHGVEGATAPTIPAGGASQNGQATQPPPDFALGPPQPGIADTTPGNVPPSDFQELSPVDQWQTLANLPFSSPETQAWASRIRRVSG
jgi:hypothetical protein